MPKFVLPGETGKRRSVPMPVCFGLTVVPALVLGISCRPFTQEHIGLGLASLIAGGFIWWTSSNLLTGVYESRQGSFSRREAPVRYWLHTAFIAALTILMISFLVHQAMQVISISGADWGK
ncbi:hypothetical protein OKA04_10885 [Luteolibacter flavescens]|uniref:Transmembrane protein n=2 Tax=Luteolibacter flavescens TaxID=1859460 RepID=A0ABT3FNT9_9BACT|nr:hypothetical protein [Luteolibacter flavescens]